MQALKMQDYGLRPLTNAEAADIDGGVWWMVAGAWVIANWDELKAGWYDGLKNP